MANPNASFGASGRRTRRRNIFNERDLARVLRAAHRAGGVARIEISSDHGTITLLLGEPPAGNGKRQPVG